MVVALASRRIYVGPVYVQTVLTYVCHLQHRSLIHPSTACSGTSVNLLTPSSPCYSISSCLDFTSKQLTTIDCYSFPSGSSAVYLSNNSIASISTAAFFGTISTVGSITKLYDTLPQTRMMINLSSSLTQGTLTITASTSSTTMRSRASLP